MLLKNTLSEANIGSRKRLDFPRLQSAVRIVESLRASASSSGEVLIVLELPVSPSDHVTVASISNLSDLLSARLLCETCAELCNVQGHTESLGVIDPLLNFLLVPGLAVVFVDHIGLTCRAHFWVLHQLAAIGVVV